MMRGQTCNPTMVLILPLAFAAVGCVRTAVPLDLASPDPTYDQTKIAAYYSREAAFFRLKSQEFAQRVLVYEGLFGTNSEWVKGARLLERYYEDAAQEQERLANLHRGLAGHEQRLVPRARPTNP
ncbi:hypothetical protein ACO9S2_14845 [Nitrospira sp. NS4]|uniref:hypothetical protein n=1 Tax=Nitrospira sp. NS4 TaxID=3414498 RepID=UPI003C2CB264